MKRRNVLLTATVSLGLGLTAWSTQACPGQAEADIADPEAGLRWFRAQQSKVRRNAVPKGPAREHGAAGLKASPQECFFYPHLQSEEELPCRAPLLKVYRAMPRQVRLIPTQRDGHSVRVAVHQVGTGRSERLLIFLPGVMTDYTTWRFVAGALGPDYDFWLVDPPGCGASDAPDPQALGPGGYGPSAMADRELQAIGRLLAERNSSVRPILVGHSMGGLAALRAVADPDLRARHADTIRRLDGVVLIAPPDVVMHRADSKFLELSNLKGGIVGAAEGLGLLRELAALYWISQSCNVRCLPREEVDAAVHIFLDAGHRRAFQAMLRDALPFHEKNHKPDWTKMHALEAWYRNVDLPVKILWGDADETMPVHMGYKLAAQLPRATLAFIPNAKHAPMIENPENCARLVRESIEAIARESRGAPTAAAPGSGETPR